MKNKSVFEMILSGEIESDIIYEDDLSIVIKDIHPQAPTHLLIIPKKVNPKLSIVFFVSLCVFLITSSLVFYQFNHFIDIFYTTLGSAFLFFYGFYAIKSAIKGGKSLEADGVLKSPYKAVISCLMLTWLNPHVYLDTVVLLGAIANQSKDPLLFSVGAVVASFIFFFSLGFGARLLRPLFSNEKSWRVLDVFIALVMWSIALSLLLGNY